MLRPTINKLMAPCLVALTLCPFGSFIHDNLSEPAADRVSTRTTSLFAMFCLSLLLADVSSVIFKQVRNQSVDLYRGSRYCK